MSDNIRINMAVEKPTVRNAIIESANLIMYHGVLCGCIYLDYGKASGQGFGCDTVIFTPYSAERREVPFAGHFIYRVLKIAGVDNWNDLVGRPVRVRATRSDVMAIGHILNDEWFDMDAEFKEMAEKWGQPIT